MNQRVSKREGAHMHNGDSSSRITNGCRPSAHEVEWVQIGRVGVVKWTANRWGGGGQPVNKWGAHFTSQNQAPMAHFSIFFGPNLPPLVPHPIVVSHHLNPSVPHPNRVPSTQLTAHSHLVGQNQAPMACFSFFLAQTQPPPGASPNCALSPLQLES